MKTMYRIEEHRYTEMERGLGTNWVMVNNYYNTVEEAEHNVTVKKDYASNGSWRIVARTIDEENFTVTEEVIKTFDYWKEVEWKAVIERNIATHTERIAKVEASKKNARTEIGLARKEKEIAWHKAELVRWENELANI